MPEPTVPSGHYPPNPYNNIKVQTHSKEAFAPVQAMTVLKTWTGAEAVAPSAAAVHASMAALTTESVVTTGFTNPPCPRNITITYGGTAGDIKAVQDLIEGTDADDQPIAELMPAATVDTAGTVSSTKAFKTVNKGTFPGMDGTGATRTVGFGPKLGLPHKLARNSVAQAHLNNVKEGTAPTVTTSSTVLANNTVQLNSSLTGNQVDLYYHLP